MHYAFIYYAFLYDSALCTHCLCIPISFFYLFGYGSFMLSAIPICRKQDRCDVAFLGLFPQIITFTELLTLPGWEHMLELACLSTDANTTRHWWFSLVMQFSLKTRHMGLLISSCSLLQSRREHRLDFTLKGKDPSFPLDGKCNYVREEVGVVLLTQSLSLFCY